MSHPEPVTMLIANNCAKELYAFDPDVYYTYSITFVSVSTVFKNTAEKLDTIESYLQNLIFTKHVHYALGSESDYTDFTKELELIKTPAALVALIEARAGQSIDVPQPDNVSIVGFPGGLQMKP